MSIIPSLVSGSGIPINKHGIIGISPGGVVAALQISMENNDGRMSLEGRIGVVGTESYGYTFQAGHTLIDKTIEKVYFFLKAGYGEITSGEISVYCGQNSSGTAGNEVIGTIDASTLSTDEFEWIEFSGTNTPTLVANDVIWIQYSSVGNQRAEIKIYSNEPSGLGLYANFWGRDGGSLPASNTEGTTDAGPTLINWQQGDAVIGYAPSLADAPYYRAMRIKVDYS